MPTPYQLSLDVAPIARRAHREDYPFLDVIDLGTAAAAPSSAATTGGGATYSAQAVERQEAA